MLRGNYRLIVVENGTLVVLDYFSHLKAATKAREDFRQWLISIPMPFYTTYEIYVDDTLTGETWGKTTRSFDEARKVAGAK